ncbi:prepilin-type N-terminal cleavage/methylation domain-containing protein [Patescibacteria group bacterium]|nr:prepilin-type N-terminal cleavage/methylation domain-containing protein [Patescibacteria group bacterium]
MLKTKGFTLIELLIVIGIVMILMATALIAINPFRQFAMANDANRWSGVTTTMNAVSQAMVDGRGAFNCTPAGAAVTDCPATGDTIPTSATNMADPTSDPTGYDICNCIVDTYVATMPYDPQNGGYTDCLTYDTDYNISCNTANGRITIEAPDAQLETISITR